jgi:hypothetical protein
MENKKELHAIQVETSRLRLKSKNVVARLSLLSQGRYDHRNLIIWGSGRYYGKGLYEQLSQTNNIFAYDITRVVSLTLIQETIGDYLKT